MEYLSLILAFCLLISSIFMLVSVLRDGSHLQFWEFAVLASFALVMISITIQVSKMDLWEGGTSKTPAEFRSLGNLLEKYKSK